MPHIYGHSATQQSTTNAQGQVAPPGFHYMPDGTLMSDAEHQSLYGANKIIQNLQLDLSNIPAIGEQRSFSITGDNGSEFIFEIKDNTTGYYYNFSTNTFVSTKHKLEESIAGGSYNGIIAFPAVTGSSDQYDIYLYAKPGTVHVNYIEVRFDDGSIDINSSTGSNSLMMQKVIHQYAALTLSLQAFSPNSTISGTFATQNFSVDRNKNKVKTSFSITATAAAAVSYKILKQPSQQDILSILNLTVGSDPELLPGEDEFPTETLAFTGDDVNGAVTSGSVVRMDNTDLSEVINVGDKITSPTTEGTVDGAVEDGVKIVLDENVAEIMAVGDQMTGTMQSDAGVILVTHLDPDGDNAKEFQIDTADTIADGTTLRFSSKVNRSHTTVTVVETSGTATDFTMSQAIQFRDNQPLTFTPRKNKRWPLDDISKLSIGTFILPGTNVTSDSFITNYENTTIINEGYDSEETLVLDTISGLDTKGQTPTLTDGVVTTQPGSVIFNKQQVLALGGDTISIAGYGQEKVLSNYGYEVLFTDLAVSLSAITTTTTSTVSNSTTVPVASVNGVLPGTTTISGIGIDPSVADPTIDSRSVTSGAGNLELSAAQTLENGITLSYSGSGQVATITGNIEVIKAGTANQTIYFDVEKLLSMS